MRKGTDTGRKRCASRRVAPSGNRFLPLLIGLVPPARYIASNRYYLACNARLNAERTCAYSVRLSAWPRPRFLINFFDKYLSKPAGQRAAQICGEIHRLGIVQSFFFFLLFSFVCIHVHTRWSQWFSSLTQAADCRRRSISFALQKFTVGFCLKFATLDFGVL